jgi:hypothetical protein
MVTTKAPSWSDVKNKLADFDSPGLIGLVREHASKTDVKIIDFVDAGHPALLRMWDKRQRGYRAMGYRIESGTVPNESLL